MELAPAAALFRSLATPRLMIVLLAAAAAWEGIQSWRGDDCCWPGRRGSVNHRPEVPLPGRDANRCFPLNDLASPAAPDLDQNPHTAHGGAHGRPGSDNHDPAYLAGRIFAAPEQIQQRSTGSGQARKNADPAATQANTSRQVNTSFTDRYFGGAVANPRIALIQGQQFAQAWLKKLNRTRPRAASALRQQLTDLFSGKAGYPGMNLQIAPRRPCRRDRPAPGARRPARRARLRRLRTQRPAGRPPGRRRPGLHRRRGHRHRPFRTRPAAAPRFPDRVQQGTQRHPRGRRISSPL